jgi:hypothetical protein
MHVVIIVVSSRLIRLPLRRLECVLAEERFLTHPRTSARYLFASPPPTDAESQMYRVHAAAAHLHNSLNLCPRLIGDWRRQTSERNLGDPKQPEWTTPWPWRSSSQDLAMRLLWKNSSSQVSASEIGRAKGCKSSSYHSAHYYSLSETLQDRPRSTTPLPDLPTRTLNS